MYRIRMVLAAATVACIVSGCSEKGAKEVAAPEKPSPASVRDARWLTDQEIEGAAMLAAKSPIMARAVAEQAVDPNLYLLTRGTVGAVGSAPDGRRVRFTVLPYQYGNDHDRAMYFAYLELGDRKRVETFELIRNRKPTAAESDFQAISPGLWLRSGPVYAETPTGTARMSPERWKWEKFAPCFVMMSELNLTYGNRFCDEMADFPHCRLIATGIAVALAAIYCAFTAF